MREIRHLSAGSSTLFAVKIMHRKKISKNDFLQNEANIAAWRGMLDDVSHQALESDEMAVLNFDSELIWAFFVLLRTC